MTDNNVLSYDLRWLVRVLLKYESRHPKTSGSYQQAMLIINHSFSRDADYLIVIQSINKKYEIRFEETYEQMNVKKKRYGV